MITVLDLWRSTIGKKVFVAVTGTILLGYLVLHMLGNLNSLFGPGGGDARIDWYFTWIRGVGEPLVPNSTVVWMVRALLLAALIIHVTGVIQLFRRNRAARPAGHPSRRIGRSLESQVMMVTGTFVLAFIVFHILQFTTLTIQITPLHHGDLYENLYYAFQEWYLVVIYLVALLLLGFHLRHGIWSVTLTLGIDNPSRNRPIRYGVTAFTVVLMLGFAAVPTLFWTGVLDEPPPALIHNLLPGALS
ncbi:MAG: succinate dehydrogenase cytochrome b subunit [Solirubrobacterales bacterium]